MPAGRDHDRRLLRFARQMRHEPSEAERRMWSIVRNRALGFHFRRQMPLLGYVADFCCVDARLVVEVDGEQHADERQQRYDAIRTGVFEDNGYRVIRFWANVVLKESDAVARTIHRELHHPDWKRDMEQMMQGTHPLS